MYVIHGFISVKVIKYTQGKEADPRSEDGMGVVMKRWVIKVHQKIQVVMSIM